MIEQGPATQPAGHHFAIAAVVPVYNRPGAVTEALASVAAQTSPPACLVVVDDGSTDETADRAAAWIEQTDLPFPAWVVRQSNQGPSVARNRGVQEAETHVAGLEAAAFLDSDDLWPTDYLARLTDAFTKQPDAVAATCDRLNVDLATHEQRLLPQHRMAHHATQQVLVHGPPGTPNTAFRLEAFHRCGGYDARFRTGQDYHLLLRISLLGPWAYVPGEPVIVRRGIEQTRQEATQNSKAYADRRLIRARMIHRFVTEEGGREAVPDRCWRRRLGALWYRAGQQLRTLGRDEQAAECFNLAVETNPRHWRARWMKRYGCWVKV